MLRTCMIIFDEKEFSMGCVQDGRGLWTRMYLYRYSYAEVFENRRFMLTQ